MKLLFLRAYRFLRNRLRRFVRYYLGHAAGFLFVGLIWSFLYTFSLCFVPGVGLVHALEAALEISFAINPPPVVIGRFVQGHILLGVFSCLGWTVLLAWYLLIPALVAAVIQRIPGMADSLFWLMQPQVAEFIKDYSRLRAAAETTTFLIRNGDEEIPSASLTDTAKATLVNVVEIVNWWYCQDLSLNSNANYMEAIRGASFHNPAAQVQFSDKRAREHDQLLSLQAWAKPMRRVPDDFLLPLDPSRPLPGAPRCFVENDTQFVPDTHDETFWRNHGGPSYRVALTGYFQAREFRSFFCMPIRRPDDRRVGALTVQVDRPRVFTDQAEELHNLVELLQPFAELLGVIIERRGTFAEPATR